MHTEKTILKLDDADYGVVVTSLAELRNDFIREKKPTGNVDEVLLKVVHAKRRKERCDGEAR